MWLIYGYNADNQLLRYDGVGAAQFGEAGCLGEAAELDCELLPDADYYG